MNTVDINDPLTWAWLLRSSQAVRPKKPSRLEELCSAAEALLVATTRSEVGICCAAEAVPRAGMTGSRKCNTGLILFTEG